MTYPGPFIPVMRASLPATADVLPRLAAVDASGWFTNFGPQERELRERFATRLGVRPEQVATVANATLGLAGAVTVLGGTRWLAPSFTFPAAVSAIQLAGAQVVLGDIDPGDWALAPDGEDVDAFLPVAPFGTRPDVARWAGAGTVVHDAAASIGDTTSLELLPPGQAVVFSLHATKVLGCGEGGIVVFGDEADVVRFRSWTNFGFSGSRQSIVAGINAKMSELHACYAHAALDNWEHELREWTDARRRVSGMGESAGLDLFHASVAGVNPYAIVVLQHEGETTVLEHALNEAGIGSRRWWAAGCHRMPSYRRLADRDLPVTEAVATTSLGIPCFRGITDEDVARVGAVVAELAAGA